MARQSWVGNAPVLRDGDIVSFSGGRSFNRFRFGSISGYAASYGEHDQVPARLVNALENGHKVVWLNAEAGIIADPPVHLSPPLQLRPAQLVFVDSVYPAERGYWLALPSERNYKTGDDAQLIRPDCVYEVWATDVATVVHEPNAASSMVASLIQQGAHAIHCVKHNPNEYSLSSEYSLNTEKN